jgi:hypothetical protein
MVFDPFSVTSFLGAQSHPQIDPTTLAIVSDISFVVSDLLTKVRSRTRHIFWATTVASNAMDYSTRA